MKLAPEEVLAVGDRPRRSANMTVQAGLKGKEGNRGQWFHQTDSLSAKVSHGCDHTIPLRVRADS